MKHSHHQVFLFNYVCLPFPGLEMVSLFKVPLILIISYYFQNLNIFLKI